MASEGKASEAAAGADDSGSGAGAGAGAGSPRTAASWAGTAPSAKPVNGLVNCLLTDMYQVTMAYGYWKAGRADDFAVFDLFFRKAPFKGEYTVFAGLEEVVKHVATYGFTDDQIAYLRSQLPTCEPGFWAYLRTLDCSSLRIYAVAEGSVVFPRVPLLRVEGPLALGQLLETTILVLCNYASLMCTNAARFRRAAGRTKDGKPRTLLEFGLRRAQGPDGAISASRYAFMGGFDGTSNVLAGQMFGMGAAGTMAHSFITTYAGLDELKTRELDGKNIVELAQDYRKRLGARACNDGELAAFVAYAQAFPDTFLALVDTYDTLNSGVPNFIAVSMALLELGHKPQGIRLDSGDLAYLSKEARKMFIAANEKFDCVGRFDFDLSKATIVASNDINEQVLDSLNDQGHEIDAFGIGTHLVTCQAQPALGMVYKLVQCNEKPRIKLSNDITKVTIPGCKEAFRLIGSEGVPLLDLIIRAGEARPEAGRRLMCRHPFDEKLRVYVTPSSVIPLLSLVYVGEKALADGRDPRVGSSVMEEDPPKAGICYKMPGIKELKAYVHAQLNLLREDHMRGMNPTPYKVSVTPELYHFIHDLWMKEVPIPEMS